MAWSGENDSRMGGAQRILRLVVIGMMLSGNLSSVSAQAPTPVPNGKVKSGSLSFDGHATVGDFTGSTTTVSGEVTGAPELSAVRGWAEAPVESIKTGDGKRDKDLNKSMEAKKYPNIRFDLVRITPAGGGGNDLTVILHGTLSIHGVTRPVELPGTIQFQESNARVRTDFPLNLKDYRIGGLSKMLGMLKMNENIEVHVDLQFQLGSGN